LEKLRSGLILPTLCISLLLSACGRQAEIESTATAIQSEPGAPSQALGPVTDDTQTFSIVSEDSQAAYIANEEFFADALTKYGISPGLNTVVGITPNVKGEILLDLTETQPLKGAQFSTDLSTLSTDQNLRDDWLHENALETDRFPQATFVATSVTGMPEGVAEGEEIQFQLTGDLTVREVTREVTFHVTAVLSGDEIRGQARADLQMSDFGIEPPNFLNTLTVEDSFSIEVTLVALRSEPPS
jgi:polyisoprenoid-binding protein YceI